MIPLPPHRTKGGVLVAPQAPGAKDLSGHGAARPRADPEEHGDGGMGRTSSRRRAGPGSLSPARPADRGYWFC